MNANAASPNTRDGQIADDLFALAVTIDTEVDKMIALVAEATREQAFGHAGLYDAVLSQLTASARDARRAAEFILNGDPEEYSEWRP